MGNRLMLGAATAALLACLGACGGSSDAPDSAPAPAPAPSETPSSSPDPYAWVDVPYAAYYEAAEKLAIRPDMLTPADELSGSLESLCTTSAEGLAELRRAQVASVEMASAFFLDDETTLRLSLACPQRIADWVSARTADEDLGGVEEGAPGEDPDYAETGYDDASPDPTAEPTFEPTPTP